MDAIGWLTLALVFVTGYYAWQTYRMVAEMRAARGVAVLPRPAPTMTYLVPDVAMPTVVNAGPGAALHVNVDLWFEPGDGFRRQWRTPVMAPGERHEFFVKVGSGFEKMSELIKSYRELRIRGTCRDALGAEHSFEDSVDIKELVGSSFCCGREDPAGSREDGGRCTEEDRCEMMSGRRACTPGYTRSVLSRCR